MHDPRNDELLRDELLRDALGRLPEVRAGEGFTRRVLARIEAEERSAAAGRTRPRRRLGLPIPTPATRWAVAAAAVLVLAVAAVLLVSPLGGPAPDRGPEAADAGSDAAGPDTTAGSPAGAATPDPAAAERLAAVDLAPPEVPLRDGEPAGDDPGATSPADPGGETKAAPGEERGEGEPDGAGPRHSGSGGREGGAATEGDRPRAGGDRNDVRLAREGGGAVRRAPSPALADPDAARRRLAELRQRQRALRAELATLSDFAQGDRAPALLLGGDESVELVVGLDPRRTADAGAVRPAVQRPAPDGSGPRYF